MAHPIYPEHQLFIDSVRRMISAELEPFVKKWEADGFFPNSVFKQLAKHGYLGILLDEEFGGIGGDYSLAAAWSETFGELIDHGLVTAVNMHSLVISAAINRYGSDEQKSKYLPLAITGDLIGAYAFTEPGAGSDLASLRTKAVRTDGGWRIDGSKTFITNGARADFVLVLARTSPAAGYNGFTTFIVDTNLPGFNVSRTLDKVGWRSSDTAELNFDNLVVSESAILGLEGQGWIQASKNLNWERLMLTLTTLGGMRSCLSKTIQYSKNRKTFGTFISEHRGIQEMIAEMRRRVFIGEALTYSALKLFLQGEDCRAQISQAKRQVCDDSVWLADRAIQIHGGYGYTTEFSPEKWWRDLRLMPIGGGTSEIMGLIVRKELSGKRGDGEKNR